MNIWEPFPAKDNTCYLRQIGPIKLWIQFRHTEWLIASQLSPEEREVVVAEMDVTPPEDLEWYRHVVPGNSRQVCLVPSTPDRPIVVKPESELKMVSGAEALFFVLIPVWITVCIGREKAFSLREIPSQVLSNTWFGEPQNGELCYSVKTSARRSIDGLLPRPHQIVCPVYIKNTAAADLNFTRLCIRTGFLSMYRGTTWLWSNAVQVQFRGERHDSKIKYAGSKPDFEPIHELITKPRSKPPKDFFLKSFDTFKLFSGG